MGMTVRVVAKETVTAEAAPARRFMVCVVQSLLSLSFNLGGMLAGTLLALSLDVFSLTPWSLALFPGILSIRGAIGGLFSGRLSTGLHLGTVRAGFTKNTKDFYLLLHATVTLALESSVVMGLTASLFSLILWGTAPTDPIAILAVVTATMALSLVFISPVTMAVSILSFRRGLDPDVIVYPVISTIADIFATACYVLVLNVFFSLTPIGHYLIGLLDLIFLFVVLYILAKNAREGGFAKTVREFFLTLISVAFIVNVTGSVFHEIGGVIGGRPEIYVVYPALITTMGGVGAIVGSTATTKLALGVVDPSFPSIKQHSNEIGGAWVSSIIMYTLYSAISSLAHRVTALNDLLRFTAQLLTANILAASATVVVAYVVAIFTYRRGWDPDNFVIPIESSLADGVTTISLLIALNLMI